MTTTFKARAVVAQNSDGIALVAMAETEVGESHYLILQRADPDGPQDVALGMNTYYVERDSQQWSCYGGITRVELQPDLLTVSLGLEGSQRLNTDEIRVSFDGDSTILGSLRTQLTLIFWDRKEVALIGF